MKRKPQLRPYQRDIANDLAKLPSIGGMMPIGAGKSERNAGTLRWEPPTLRMDGSPLTDVAGYRIYRARSPHAQIMGLVAEIPDPNKTDLYVTYVDAGGRWYYRVASYQSDGRESMMSDVV